MVYTPEAAPDEFVSVGQEADWVFVSIGYAYGDQAAAHALTTALNAGSTYEPENVVNAIASLFGQFCLVAYNLATRNLVLASDPTGVRSLFLQDVADRLAVSSSLPMLRKLKLLDGQRAFAQWQIRACRSCTCKSTLSMQPCQS